METPSTEPVEATTFPSWLRAVGVLLLVGASYATWTNISLLWNGSSTLATVVRIEKGPGDDADPYSYWRVFEFKTASGATFQVTSNTGTRREDERAIGTTGLVRYLAEDPKSAKLDEGMWTGAALATLFGLLLSGGLGWLIRFYRGVVAWF